MPLDPPISRISAHYTLSVLIILFYIHGRYSAAWLKLRLWPKHASARSVQMLRHCLLSSGCMVASEKRFALFTISGPICRECGHWNLWGPLLVLVLRIDVYCFSFRNACRASHVAERLFSGHFNISLDQFHIEWVEIVFVFFFSFASRQGTLLWRYYESLRRIITITQNNPFLILRLLLLLLLAWR